MKPSEEIKRLSQMLSSTAPDDTERLMATAHKVLGLAMALGPVQQIRKTPLAHNANVMVSVYFRRPTHEEKGYISAYTTHPGGGGNDLADGDFKQETVERVKRDLDMVFTQQSAECQSNA